MNRIGTLHVCIAAKTRSLQHAQRTLEGWREFKAKPVDTSVPAWLVYDEESRYRDRQAACDRAIPPWEARVEKIRAELVTLRAELATLDNGRCGARCRDGHACKAPRVGGKGKRAQRCKRHGGRSTGPTTPEGRARSREALHRAAVLRELARAHRREGAPSIDLDG